MLRLRSRKNCTISTSKAGDGCGTPLGISRSRQGKGFAYIANGKPVKDGVVLDRIRSLVIPPAWTEVWINPSASAPLQATGRDAKGRKQYIYHPEWRASRERHKYRRILRFATELPAIRRRVRRDLRGRKLESNKVLATVIALLDRSLIRIGNPEYARQNNSYGLTTLRDGQVKVGPEKVNFRFRGKSQQFHSIEVKDPELARIVRQCRALPGEHLFQYIDDDGEPHKVSSLDVNRYLRAMSRPEFSAKDFRTWAATVQMITELLKRPPCSSTSAAKRDLKECLCLVSSRLGNTPSVCRKSYIHPIILKAYLERKKLPKVQETLSVPKGFTKKEAVAFRVLNKLLRRAA